MSGVVYHDIQRADKHIVSSFKAMPTTIISDAMNRTGAMRANIKSINPGKQFAGTAVTIQGMVGCNLMSHMAIYVAHKGDVLVFDAKGHIDTAVWGYLQTRACELRGICAVVIDGAVRDSEEMYKAKLPVFCAGVSPIGPHKGWGDSINVPIQCGGVSVEPGDIIRGDSDGIVVVPKNKAKEVLKAAESCLKKEKEWFERLEKGESTISILDLDSKIKSLGVKIR